MKRKMHTSMWKKRNWKRTLAGLMVIILFLVVVSPIQVSAAPPWWNRFKDIVVADAVGALDGFVQTETLGGAIFGGIAGSLKEGFDQGISGGGWNPDQGAKESVGLHHNLGLNFYFDQGAPERLDGVLLEYLAQQRIPVDQQQIQAYLRGLNPTLEEFLRRIREGTTGPFNPNPGASDDGHGGSGGHGVIVSENFFPNLQRTLAILDGNKDNPQEMLDEAIAFFLNASLRETDHDLMDDIIIFAQDYNSTRSNRRKNAVDLGGEGTGLDFDKIKITYEQQKSNGQPSDIILAWVFVDVLQQSSLYWSDVYCWGERGRDTEIEVLGWCWGGNFSRIMMNPDADPDTDDVFILVGDYLDLDSDGDGIPDVYEPGMENEEEEEPTSTEEYKLVLTIDRITARSGDQIKTLDTAPFVKEGRTLVPFRFIGEELGATIDWDPDERKVSYVLGDIEVELWIGQSRATVNGTPTTVDVNPSVTPVIVNGRTVVPVRFISEVLGAQVDWNPDIREIIITKEADKSSPR